VIAERDQIDAGFADLAIGARQTAGALGLKLTEPEIHAITRPATSNPLANEAYLKGRYVWLQRTPDSYRQAREYFEQAIALDSNYALAYAGLADAYQFLGAFNLPDRKENYDKAKSAYGRALELDPTLAEAHATAGLVAMNYDWDWSLAEQELRRAIALNPNEALFYDWYAEYLMAIGKANESIDNIERAHELDPFSIIINSDVGKLLFFARLYDQAEAQLKETLRMNPAFMEAHVWLGIVYLMKQRFDEAIAEFKIGEVNGLQGLMAYAHGKAGRKTEARQMLEATKKLLTQRGDMDNVWLTFAYIGMGVQDENPKAAFEATIKKEPNRFNAFVGAAKAAERLGDKTKAKDYYQKLTTLASNADTNRPDLVAAREFLAKN
jgi:tetratricopeptide (TPR) repeat protein